MRPDLTPSQILGDRLVQELRDRGFVIVPMHLESDTVNRLENAPTGSFSNWAVRALWLSMLALIDPRAKPQLDELAKSYRRG